MSGLRDSITNLYVGKWLRLGKDAAITSQAAGGHVNLLGNARTGTTGTPGEVQVNGNSAINNVSATIVAADVSRHVFICTRAMRLKTASVVFTVAGGAGAAVTIEKLTGTTAAGSGTALLTATMILTGAANTVVNGTLIATVTSLTFAAGDRIGVVLSGTLTGLAGGIVSIGLNPV